ncbi:zinc-dependent metalloprotease [Pseudobacteriovorax antillogorgiicola]|uniref:EcxA zinc-binding domain-containing protein n=1 Tax=Pseudobacteriovorax antillogorgiicola TaxID=1513793 RepID=A0A1Y6BED0_9BACT|nr:zinc-dependent metalloprotease [Pseudobacteriovorax antillogorgiicola]TCS58586.1 uncharacterized protein DUF4953 [Pseudobacteriovorax antillogorgiicola]SME97201.1 protein of unknown function [Pseudobacteriovorax antillogorgiicola]
MKHLALITTIGLAFSLACAKKRPVEKVQTLDASRWAKGVFENGQKWLYKVTIVNNTANAALGFVGLQSDMRLGTFRFTENSLEFLSSEEVFGDDTNNAKVINSWSGTHSDYHRAVVGGQVSNVESENDEIPWNEKSFFIVDWTSAIVSEEDSFGYGIRGSRCFDKAGSRLIKDSESIESEHVTFTIAVDFKGNGKCAWTDDIQTLHYKYSFIPDKPTDYEPYVYTGEVDPLMKKYGYFNTVVPRVDANNRLQYDFVMNRWDPKKTHTFYFAEDFPNEYKWIYNDPEAGIFARTNKLFEENGIATRFEIQDNDGSKKFGDLRYSFIKFIDHPERQAPLGYGPSDAHPITGEIITANSMMWISDLKFYALRYRDEVEYEKIQDASSSIYREMGNILGNGPTNWTETAGFLENADLSFYYRYLVPEFTYSSPGNYFTRAIDNTPFQGYERTNQYIVDKLGPTSSLPTHLQATEETIREGLEKYANAEKYGNNSFTVFEFNEAIFGNSGNTFQDATSEQVINDILYRVAVHEFGHNLNLRHNFYGSVDARINRIRGEDLSLKRTSSVMDYLTGSDEVGLAYDWEDYDRAALLYAYSDGKVDMAKKTGIVHLYCTDDHEFFNPMCNTFDQGATPTEILMSMIDNYDSSYRWRNFRYDRAIWDTRSYEGRMLQTMLRIKLMVKLYQETFLPSQVAQEMAGLDFLSPTFKDNLTAFIRQDITEAVKLSAAFFAAVIKQSSFDRDHSNLYDEFTGQLKQVGIYPDKAWAQRFLMFDDAFPLNPNFGFIPVSYINLRSNTQIGPVVDSILFDSFVNAGEAPYTDFDDLGRLYYGINAARFFDFEGEQGAVDLMKIECFTSRTFNSQFGVDSATLDPGFNRLTPDWATLDANANDYFKTETEVLATVINDEVYVTGPTKNRYAAGVFLNNDLNGVLNSHRFYKDITRGEVESCQ